MTLQALRSPILWPYYQNNGTAISLSTEITLDASGEYRAYIAAAKEAMTISHVGFFVGVVAGSPTLDVRIETVNTADAFPSGTLWATDTNLVTGTLSSSTWNLVELTAPATIAAGQVFAVVIRYTSGTSAILQRLNGFDTPGAGLGLPYKVTNTGTPTAAQFGTGGTHLIALGSSATAFYSLPCMVPYSTHANTAFNNSAGGRRGVRFQSPFKCRVAGIMYGGYATNVGDLDIAMYNDAGTELSNSQTAYDSSQLGGNNGPTRMHYFDNPVAVDPGTWYRAALIPSSATNIQLSDLTVPSADYMTAMPGGANYHLTTYTTAGGWIDTATASVPTLSLLIDQLDDGAGAAGGGIRLAGHGGLAG